MAQAVLTVLLVVILVAYGAGFALWNQGSIDIIGLSLDTFGLQGMLSATVPIFLLPIAGLAAGAVLMAIVMSAPWSSMKRALGAAQERASVEQARNRDLSAKLKACRERLKSAPAAQGPAEPAEGA